MREHYDFSTGQRGAVSHDAGDRTQYLPEQPIRRGSRSVRRHHRARLIAKRTRVSNPYWGRLYYPGIHPFTPAQAGQLARTPKNCNCWMCRNPRGVFRELLLREKSDLEAIRREVV